MQFTGTQKCNFTVTHQFYAHDVHLTDLFPRHTSGLTAIELLVFMYSSLFSSFCTTEPCQRWNRTRHIDLLVSTVAFIIMHIIGMRKKKVLLVQLGDMSCTPRSPASGLCCLGTSTRWTETWTCLASSACPWTRLSCLCRWSRWCRLSIGANTCCGPVENKKEKKTGARLSHSKRCWR